MERVKLLMQGFWTSDNNPLKQKYQYLNQDENSQEKNNQQAQSQQINQEQVINVSIDQNDQGDQNQIKEKELGRIRSIDVLRGLNIVLMILIDSMGNYDCVVSPLRETQWDGLSPADCIFPTFLFILGASIPFGKKSIVQQTRTNKILAILKRASILFLIGMLINIQQVFPDVLNNPPFQFNFRVMAVLQRLAICYTIVQIIHQFVSSFLVQLLFILLFQILYFITMYTYNVPGCGIGNLSPECNFSKYLDELILSKDFLMQPTDPEGLISTCTSLINVYIGYLFSKIMMRNKQQRKKIFHSWISLSIACLITGISLSNYIPINKKIWSPSFAFVTSGLTSMVLIIIYLIVDNCKQMYHSVISYYIQPFQWFGLNSLAVYVGMQILDGFLMENIKISFINNEGKVTVWSLQKWISINFFQQWIGNCDYASLFVAFIHLCLWLFVTQKLYMKNIIIKI